MTKELDKYAAGLENRFASSGVRKEGLSHIMHAVRESPIVTAELGLELRGLHDMVGAVNDPRGEVSMPTPPAGRVPPGSRPQLVPAPR